MRPATVLLTMRHVADNIQRLAKAKGLTVTSLAEKIPEVSRSAVSHWWHAIRKPGMDHVRLLARALEASMEEIVAGDPEYATTPLKRKILAEIDSLSAAQQEALLVLIAASKTIAR